jgi:hypothetical protein
LRGSATLAGACSARLFDRERDLAFDQGFADRGIRRGAKSECESTLFGPAAPL